MHTRSAAWRPGFFEGCANPHCASGRLKLWRSRRTSIFEGGWCCSPACARARVEAALGREMDARGQAPETRRHRIPLGLAMLEQGWITGSQLRRALDAQKTAGAGKVGQWLVRQKVVNEELVTRALGLQWSCPVLSIESHNVEGMARLLPRLFVDAFGVVPLRVAAGRILYLGFEDRPDPVLALAVERMTGLHVETGVVAGPAFRAAHQQMLAARYPRAGLIEATSDTSLAQALLQAMERARPAEARLARVHDCLWLRMWLRPQKNASPETGSVEDLIGSAAG
ncbi:MAG TPA: hypothetical protein VGG26_11455 [Terracidiphilus sp.]